MQMADEWHMPLWELAARMPAYELGWWRTYYRRQNDKTSQAAKSKAALSGKGRTVDTFG